MKIWTRPWTLLALLAVLTIALVAVACDDDEEEAAGMTPTGETPAAGETPAGETPTGDMADDFRAAILLPGTVDDFGYNAVGQLAANAIEDELGIEVTFTESVPVPEQTDVYRQFAQQDFDMVIGWGGQFSEGAVQAAEEFPDTYFFVVNSNVENGTNLGSFDTDVQDWQFVGGYALARLSSSGVVGWVGGQCFPATAKNLHGTEQGAAFANSDIEFQSTFTGDFEDPVRAQQAAEAMIEQGADVLTGNLNNGWFGVFEAARAADVLVITEWIDNSDQAPNVIAASILKDQSPFLVDIVRQTMEGSFPAEFQVFGLPADWGPALSDTDLLPDEIHQEALDVQDQIVAGEIEAEEDTTCP